MKDMRIHDSLTTFEKLYETFVIKLRLGLLENYQ